MFTDIHSHIVYGIDDGARTLDEAEELVVTDIREGAERIISTSHYYVDAPSDPDIIHERLDELRERLAADDTDIEIIPGNEALYFDSMVERLDRGEILTLGNSRYVLVEFYPRESYQTYVRAVRSLVYAGYTPIIAHAERFKALHENGLREVRKLGALVQVSTEPLSRKGLSGMLDQEASFIRKALKNQEADFVGTDMHRMSRRPPVARDAEAYIRKHCSPSYAADLLSRNADMILQDFGS
ncbi:MAG: CpsB/CapC family capsule biosynthesis tyrosine phosphatase [Oribacterium sp.]|nr:CpsB/CapC family capsule biosynthesis tyrosine phosphatase [Oribacterium sp.]